jgi:aminoglycoside 6'-N-acetyltransferase
MNRTGQTRGYGDAENRLRGDPPLGGTRQHAHGVQNAMHLRRATRADLTLLKSWDTKPHVAAATGADGAFDWESELGHDPDWRELLIAEEGGRAIGVMQIIDPAEEETHYWGAIESGLRAIDIWIGEEGDLGRGYGTRMMRLALKRCFAEASTRAVLVDPLAGNSGACRFYERLGFRSLDRRTFGTDDCLVYRLDRLAWQQGAGDAHKDA